MKRKNTKKETVGVIPLNKVKGLSEVERSPLNELKDLGGNVLFDNDGDKWTWSIPKDKVGTFPLIVEVIGD